MRRASCHRGPRLTLFLAANAAVTIGLCLSAVARSAEAAASVLPLVILPMVILGGILMPLAELPRPATFLADAMPSRWAFEALLVGESEARATLELPDSSDPISPTERRSSTWPRVGFHVPAGEAAAIRPAGCSPAAGSSV